MNQYEINDLVFEVMHRYVDADKTVTVYDMLNDREIMDNHKYRLIEGTLTSEEKFDIKRIITDKGCYNCMNKKCDKIPFDSRNTSLDKRLGKSCMGWDNSTEIGKQVVLLLKK